MIKMSPQCKKYHKNLVAYLDKELSDRKSTQLAGHLQSCTACRRELDGLKESMEALLEWESIKPSPEYDHVFWGKVQELKSVEAKGKAKRAYLDTLRSFFNPKISLATSAAMAAVILVITFFAFKPPENVSQNGVHVARDFELFFNMEVIENSEALENFEVISLLDVLEQETNG